MTTPACSTDIRLVHKNAYPTTLANMPSPPARLYIRGELKQADNQRYLCVVGSRHNTSYGQTLVRELLAGLAGYPISIVSGLAFGIDSMSHTVALEYGMHCVAFPGSTLEWNMIYPREHESLARQIVVGGGALISEWPSGYPTGDWAFPARNRLMAGISHATLVIEAAKGSGSLLTAKHAEDFSRDVLAVPGPVDAPNSYGPHMLIRAGAALIRHSTDILEALEFAVVRRPSGSDAPAVKFDPSCLPAQIRRDKLAQKILGYLYYEDMTVKVLQEKCLVDTPQLNICLANLELERLIRIQSGRISLRRSKS
ncbi:MAG: DNA-processing protein DprA [Patescibacteria group bacterium]|nr:DNA-processing protein DprA [Patescibacteria group bacterium]